MRRAFFFIVAIAFATTSLASIPRVSALDPAPPIADLLSETRIRVSEVLAPFERPAGSELTRALRQGYEQASTTNASGLGRFLSVDPHGFWELQSGSEDEQRTFRRYLAEPQRWNRYSYVQNNPLRYVDPDGRESRAAIALEHDIRDLSAGRITQEEYFDRIQARGVGAGIGVATVLGGVGGFRLAVGLATRFGLMGASLSGAGGAGALKAIEQVSRADGRIFQTAMNAARGTPNTFMNNLTALARAVDQLVPGGKINAIGKIGDQVVYGSARTRIGITVIDGVTKVVRQVGDKWEVLGNFR